MTTEYEEKIVRVCRELKKPKGERLMAGSHRFGGWDTEVVARTMEKHGLPQRFRPDVMDGLGAGFMPGKGSGQTLAQEALNELAARIDADA